ncbi:MAG TPA: BglII/BstYI family type II restriction endonuclease [Gemmatimonadales bacterium]|nr:BglII/BstYI family type II restriction endonuclease [Gemmatimonadales bacterium]
MRIVGEYSFKGGQRFIQVKYPTLLQEVEEVVGLVAAAAYKTKSSREKTMPGRMLYNPAELNDAFKKQLTKRSWRTVRVPCDYPTNYYREGYRKPKGLNRGAFREMDFVKEHLGLEVQFGKYAFMVYNVCAKMTIFNRLGIIDAGMEIVPVKEFADEMSTGVSYFEQFVWDLEHRGVADIDIPVLVYGISA